MSFYQPGTFGNIDLYRYLNQNFGVKASPTVKRALFTRAVNNTAPFTASMIQAPRATTAAVGRTHVGSCCAACAAQGK